jgi:CRP-like cAMP-binding protein
MLEGLMNPLIAKFQMGAMLSADDHQSLYAVCEIKQTVNRSMDVVREGDSPAHVYIVLDGWAARYKVLPDGSRQITAFLLPGDFCNGEITVFKKMDHSVVALTPLTVALASPDTLIAMIRDQPELAQAFRRAALVDEAVLRAWVVNLGRRDAYGRVAHQACELHARMSHLSLLKKDEFDLPLTQEQLGDALGLTAVHVNRILKRLRDEGLMQLQNRTLTLLDAKRLGEVAGFNPDYLHTGTA